MQIDAQEKPVLAEVFTEEETTLILRSTLRCLTDGKLFAEIADTFSEPIALLALREKIRSIAAPSPVDSFWSAQTGNC